jgi:hypothetical protein
MNIVTFLLVALAIVPSQPLAQQIANPKSTVERVEVKSFRGKAASAKWNPSEWGNLPADSGGDYARFQLTPMWCWAACLQMVIGFASKEDVVAQADIVVRNYGVPVVAGAQTLEQIRANLDLWIPRRSGNDIRLTGESHDSQLSASELYDELSEQRPVILE